MPAITLNNKEENLPWLAFYWAITFTLYFSASGAGMEGDFPYWVQSTRANFLDYINTISASEHTFYQVTQTAIYLIYKIFGLHPMLWHILQVTLHAGICYGLFRIWNKIFADATIGHPRTLAIAAALLFCIAPYQSEVVVRESCYHYQQGFLFILSIVACVLKFIDTQKTRYAWYAGITYLLSIFSLEMFYATPWLVLLLLCYYHIEVKRDKQLFRKTLFIFFVPEVVLFFGHLLLMRLVWGNRIPHVGIVRLSDIIASGKPVLYYFHGLLLGRYFPWPVREKIYDLFEQRKTVALVCNVAALVILMLLLRTRSKNPRMRLCLVLFIISLLFLGLAIPLDFTKALYIIGDRYLYIPSAFTAACIVLLISSIRHKSVAIISFLAWLFINIIFTIRTNNYWHQASSISNRLLTGIPPAEPQKKILLLNLPACINGALMIRAQPESEFKLMNNTFAKNNMVPNEVFDVSAYNMLHVGDGAHVTVMNDSTLHVVLNQWGSWWWYSDQGAYSYENDQYKVNMADVGHWYELTIKHPATEYMTLFQVGDTWKTVDWGKKNIEQY